MPTTTHLLPLCLLLAGSAAPQDPQNPQAAQATQAEAAPLPVDSLPQDLPLSPPFGLDELPQPVDPAMVGLGRRLFFDPVLSADRTVACASCHQPDHGFADPRPLSLGIDGQESARHAPTLLNRGQGTSFMWDGRADTLEDQVVMPIANPVEMGLGIDRAVARLTADPDWAGAFQAATGAGPTAQSVPAALASFVRVLHVGDSPVDRFRGGQVEHLDNAERAGLWIYESRGQCWRCHSGGNFTDEAFHNTGIGSVDGVPEEGRFGVTGKEADRGAFKTPTLRGLAHTAPYMHDGSQATLEEVVQFYADGGRDNSHLSPHMPSIRLDERDVTHLVAFLRALSRPAPGEPPIE